MQKQDELSDGILEQQVSRTSYCSTSALVRVGSIKCT